MMDHCTNNKADRAIGATWERNFCKLAVDFGFVLTPMQIGRGESAQAYSRSDGKWNCFTLPDITVWTCPGQHHEIKHKNPTRAGTFGLEEYRLQALLSFALVTQQDVMYTIHNHDLAGGREVQANNLDHWLTVNVLDLEETEVSRRRFPSWVNGQRKDVLQYFWSEALWFPLRDYFVLNHEEGTV